MKTTQTVVLLLLAACSVAGAQVHKPERVLNLKGLQIFGAGASGTRLFLSVTGQPPDISSLIKPTPTPLKGRDPSGGRPKVQVLLGKDILGMAEVSGISEQALRLAASTNAPKTKLTSVVLTFETPEQAARAAQALRVWDTTPTPLQRQKDNK